MEWIVLIAVAAAAAAYILMPRPADREVPEEERVEALRGERAALLELLRELDDDAATGRISAEDRLDGRRALGPRLREVTEALQQLGERSEPLRLVREDRETDAPAEPGGVDRPVLEAVESEPVERRS